MSWNENTMQGARYVCDRIPEEGEEILISAEEDPFWIPAKRYLDSALDEIERLRTEASKDADRRVVEDLREWLERFAVDQPEFSEEARLFEILLGRFETDRELEQWKAERGAKSWL